MDAKSNARLGIVPIRRSEQEQGKRNAYALPHPKIKAKAVKPLQLDAHPRTHQ